MCPVLLSTTYFGPVQWYQKLYRHGPVLIEQHETFRKQTYRNRCIIATTQGVQALTVPVSWEHGHSRPQEWEQGHPRPQDLDEQTDGHHHEICHLRLSDHGNWRRLHWQALQSAYGESPFFEYYEDDLRPFFTEHRWELLMDYNEAICLKMCELLDIRPDMSRTTEYTPAPLPAQVSSAGGGAASTADFRDAIRPKHPDPDPTFLPRPYYQVFAHKHGFLPNLSILDLLMNMGPESIFYL